MTPETDSSAVVDAQWWILRMQNLRVINASTMSTMLSANLNAGVLMIAENSPDLMLKNQHFGDLLKIILALFIFHP